MSDANELSQAIAQREMRIRSLEAEIKSIQLELAPLRAAQSIISKSGATGGRIVFPPDHPLATPLVAAGNVYGAVKGAIEKAAKSFPPGQNFTVNDIAKKIVSENPLFNVENNKANLSSYLREFADGGKIELAQQGRGRRPAFYRNKK